MHQGCKVSSHVLGNKPPEIFKNIRKKHNLEHREITTPAKNIKNIIKWRNRSKNKKNNDRRRDND